MKPQEFADLWARRAASALSMVVVDAAADRPDSNRWREVGVQFAVDAFDGPPRAFARRMRQMVEVLARDMEDIGVPRAFTTLPVSPDMGAAKSTATDQASGVSVRCSIARFVHPPEVEGGPPTSGFTVMLDFMSDPPPDSKITPEQVARACRGGQ